MTFALLAILTFTVLLAPMLLTWIGRHSGAVIFVDVVTTAVWILGLLMLTGVLPLTVTSVLLLLLLSQCSLRFEWS